jgi:ferritin-like metal-binding protein YciE
MERAVLMMLNSMILSTSDEVLVAELRRHREETREHERRVAGRLSDLGAGGSLRKQAVALGPTLMKGVLDQVRPDKPNKNARDGFMTEHLEIATYELLERLAERAGDTETAQVARLNRAEEERMAKAIADNWERAVDLTLGRHVIRQPASRRQATRRRSARTSRRRTSQRSRTSAGA